MNGYQIEVKFPNGNVECLWTIDRYLADLAFEGLRRVGEGYEIKMWVWKPGECLGYVRSTEPRKEPSE